MSGNTPARVGQFAVGRVLAGAFNAQHAAVIFTAEVSYSRFSASVISTADVVINRKEFAEIPNNVPNGSNSAESGLLTRLLLAILRRSLRVLPHGLGAICLQSEFLDRFSGRKRVS